MTRRDLVVCIARALEGCPYVWGGNALQEGGLDCSGYVQHVYRHAGIEPYATDFPVRLDLTADGLRSALAPRDAGPLPGDLAFYGTPDRATHVMIVLGTTEHGVGVAGASRGDSSVKTVADALAKGAVVRLFASHLYRKDFIGFRRMPEAPA